MLKTYRASTTAVLILCLLGGPSSGILFASEKEPSVPATTSSASEPLPGTTEFVRSLVASSPQLLRNDTLIHLPVFARPDEPSLFAQRGGRGRGYGGRRNGAAAAVFLGAAAAIAGTAVLVYANRPECSTIPTASGCGYGTKVVGGAVLSAGVVGLVVGAAMWR
jgi:hypothetical protein